MAILIEAFEGGPAQTIGYVVADDAGGPAVIIDAPLGTAAAMVEQAQQWQRSVAYLLTTHAHWDHVLDNARVIELTHAQYGIHPESVPLLEVPQTQMFGLDIPMRPIKPDLELRDGQTVAVGKLRLRVLDCPGHCPGSVALFEANERVVFTGDVLFAGSIGRTDLWGGDYETLLSSIRRKLVPLGDDVRVFAGHGPVTTIGQERQENPFLTGPNAG